MTLNLRGGFPRTVFDLIGQDENSATYALGWALEQSPTFTRLFVCQLAGHELVTDGANIHLQAFDEDGGFTDLELRCGDVFEAIIEAKVGWHVPARAQLERYRPRLRPRFAGLQMLVSMSAANPQVARLTLPGRVKGIRVEHLSYGTVRQLAKKARRLASSFAEKLWLEQFAQHMEGYAAMSRVTSNLVYVVSLGSTLVRTDGKRTWIDVVEEDQQYFHPVGRHWLKEPPNYIGFRYRGKVQSVHRIEAFEIVPNLAIVNPTWPVTKEAHFVYQLGPAMHPSRDLRAGGSDDKVKRSARVWCAIDTLLSGEFSILYEAREETEKRRKKAEEGGG